MSAEARVLGLDFRRDDGSSATLGFRSGELVDLIDLQDGDPLRLFTDEERPVGRYTGVRLLFDEARADYTLAPRLRAIRTEAAARPGLSGLRVPAELQ